ncbi:MAG TPA: hypothetical protein VJ396_08455, partial [Acidiferrobacterales bacterium]|nr:hypothetical protein [Acidiferrobacterales bacterium]
TFPIAVWERLDPVSVTNCIDGFNAFLVDIEEECARRSRLFNQHLIDGLPPEDLEAYNTVADEALPPLVLLVDEFNSFALRVEFADIARRNQKYGLMCVLAAHSWRARNVPPELSELMQSRVCFRVESIETARAVVHSTADARAALHLEQQGRAITNLTGQYETMQVYLVESGEIVALMQAGATQQFDGRPARVALSETEQAIADAVITKLGGVFSVDRLRRLLAGSVSDRQIRNASARWAAADRRWFEAPIGTGRPLSERFYEQTGLSQPDRAGQGTPLETESEQGGKADQGGKAGKGQENRRNREADEVAWVEGLIARTRAPDRLAGEA